MAFKTAQDNSSDVFELDYTLSGLGFWPFSESPKAEIAQSEAHWWDVTRKFKNLWGQLKGKIKGIQNLPILAKSNLSRWKKQPISAKSKAGVARSMKTLSLAEELKAKVNKYLPEWLNAEKKLSKTQAQTLSGDDDGLGFEPISIAFVTKSLIIGTIALSVLVWSLTNYKEVSSQALLEKKVLDTLEKKELTSDEAIDILKSRDRSGDGKGKKKDSDKSFIDKIADTFKNAATGGIVIVGIMGLVVTYLVVKEIKK